jgi:hypothetical protein
MHDVFRAAHCARRADFDDVAGEQPVEQHSQRGEVLLDGRRRELALQLLDEGRDVDRLHRGELIEATSLAPRSEAARGVEIGFTGVVVVDLGGEEFEDAPRREQAGGGGDDELAGRAVGHGMATDQFECYKDGVIAVVTTASRMADRHDNRVGSAPMSEGLMKYFAGLDVSLQETAICIVDEHGIVVSEGKAASEPDDLVRWLAATGLTIARVGLEAGPLSPWLYAGLRAAGLPAICIETRRMKGATAAMAVKTDRNDARAIAHAMRVGWFTAVHVKTAESQELRLLLSNRRTLLEKRIAIDNEIRGTLKAFGLKLGTVTVAAFEARALELLAERSRLLAMVRPMLAARAALR